MSNFCLSFLLTFPIYTNSHPFPLLHSGFRESCAIISQSFAPSKTFFFQCCDPVSDMPGRATSLSESSFAVVRRRSHWRRNFCSSGRGLVGIFPTQYDHTRPPTSLMPPYSLSCISSAVLIQHYPNHPTVYIFCSCYPTSLLLLP